MNEPRATFRCVDGAGNRHEVELTEAQAVELATGRAVAYFPRDEKVALNGDGSLTFRESAVPQYRDAA